MTAESLFGRVLGSSVRTDVLRSVAAEARETEGVIESVDASESAVYTALADLEDQGLVRSAEAGWTTTGSGRLVADLLAQQADLSALLAEEYWETHDVGTLPRRFRLRLPDLAEAGVYRAPDTNPHSVVQRVSDRIEAGGDDVDIATSVFQPEYEAVMPDDENARLLVDSTMIREAIEHVGGIEEARQFDRTTARVGDVDVSVGVTDESLMLSLPRLDGSYDSRTEVFATDERARAWGEDLFDYYWARATPAAEFLSEFFD